ncbi:MAG TPA: apolipoprotein N-acyltransferase [Casimicrobiaceae bacterium]|nr:apolipoprotein N-acyltransferase [Casimicrobiaceae bacterium]
MSPEAGSGRALRLLLAFAAGALTVFGFAPFHFALLPLATLALLFWLWQRAGTPGDAALTGFAFGMGLFGVGISWISVALETFGGVPTVVAFLGMLGLTAYLSLYPALAGWAVTRFTAQDSFARLAAIVAAWALAEWLRGTLLTGFGWLAVGYAQLLPSHALPLAGFAPLGGVYLVSLVTAACAAALAYVCDGLVAERRRALPIGLASIALCFGAGAVAGRISWTIGEGAPLAVSLVQGNVAQHEKFDPAYRARNFDRYRQLVKSAAGRLVVLPESAFTVFLHEVPAEVLQDLEAAGRGRGGDVLVGLFTIEAPLAGDEDPRIYNSVLSLGTAEPQLYRKHHLVPFGESIPLKSLFGWFINRVLDIPLADQAAGPARQRPFDVAGQRVAVNICYEDVFGAELAGVARHATLFVNVTNDAWYGRSIGALQHNQIAQMRALELGRPMLRATNTGITSAIAHDGLVLAQLPWFTQGILDVEIAGRRGETPFVRWGDALAAGLAGGILVAALAVARRRNKTV